MVEKNPYQLLDMWADRAKLEIDAIANTERGKQLTIDQVEERLDYLETVCLANLRGCIEQINSNKKDKPEERAGIQL